MSDVTRGLRQAAVMLGISAAVAGVVSWVWSAVADGGFWSKTGIALTVLAA